MQGYVKLRDYYQPFEPVGQYRGREQDVSLIRLWSCAKVFFCEKRL